MTELQNKEILHQVYYERYKTGEVNKLIAILDTANRNIAELLKSTKGIYSKMKYRKLSKSIKEITDNIKDLMEQEIDVEGIIEAELKNQVKLFTQITQGKVEIKTPKVSAVKEKAMFTPVVNQTFSQYLEGISKGAFQIWDNAVRTGYVTGQTTQQIVKTVMGSISTRIDMLESGTMQRLRNSVMANTKTQLQALANGTRRDFYEENSDLIKGYQWLSTLDKRTCFPEGQKVLTPTGERNIETLKVGDIVYNGKREETVIIDCQREIAEELIEINLESGKTIICTTDHLIMTNRGWVRADELNESDEIRECL